MEGGRSPEAIKRMADLLRAGAAMLSERCPACGLPLFRLRSGEVVCPVHGRVYIVRDESEASRITVRSVLEELERFVAHSLSDVVRRAGATSGNSVADELRSWLDVLERVERILDMISTSAREEGLDDSDKPRSSQSRNQAS